MRENEITQKKAEFQGVLESLTKVKSAKRKKEEELEKESEMKKMSRLLYAGEIVERSGLLYKFNEENLYKVLMENRKKITKVMM